MSDKKELVSEKDREIGLNRYIASGKNQDECIGYIKGFDDSKKEANQRYSEAMARYEAMLELTSQSVEDGIRLYTEKELKKRAKEAWCNNVRKKWILPKEFYDHWDNKFEDWYNEKYGSDEPKRT